MSGVLPKGTALVMSDLFISATATLLIVLALLRPEPPVQLPIQADLVARCTSEAVRIWSSADPFRGDGYELVAPGDLIKVPIQLGLPLRRLYTIALVPNAGGGVAPGCFLDLRDRILRPANRLTAETSASEPGHRPIFTLAFAVSASDLSLSP